MITPEQCRAARAWLGWSQEALAKAATVGLSTLRDFENAKRKPMGNNAKAIVDALAKKGVHMVFNDQGKATGITGPVVEADDQAASGKGDSARASGKRRR